MLNRREFIGRGFVTVAGAAMASAAGPTWLGLGASGAGAVEVPLTVRLWAPSNNAFVESFATAHLPSGPAAGKLPIEVLRFDALASFPEGKCLSFPTVASDGQVFLGVASQSGSVKMLGATQNVVRIDPIGRTVSMLALPTSHAPVNGVPVTEARTVGVDLLERPTQGGADTSDAVTFFTKDALGNDVEHVLFNSMFPYGLWKVYDETPANATKPFLTTGKGLFRTSVVLTKDASGVWVLDEALSKTAEQLYFSAKTAIGSDANARKIFPVNPNAGYLAPNPADGLNPNFPDLNPAAGEPVVGAMMPAEVDRFANNHIVFTQYGTQTGSSAGMFVIDEHGEFVTSYKFPDFYDVRGKPMGDPNAKPVGWASRYVATDPANWGTTAAPKYRFFVMPDSIPPAASVITHVTCVGDNIVTLKFAAAHPFGPGQFLQVTGLATDCPAVNTPAGQSSTMPIRSCPTSDTVTFFVPGASQVDKDVVNCSARLRAEAAIVELEYDPVAKTITPKSMPCHVDDDRNPIGMALVDNDGNLLLNPTGGRFRSGPLSVWKKVNGERENVTAAQWSEVNGTCSGWGTVVRPSVAFGSTAGTNVTAAGGIAFDPHASGLTAYVMGFDALMRVKLTYPLVAGMNQMTALTDFDTPAASPKPVKVWIGANPTAPANADPAAATVMSWTTEADAGASTWALKASRKLPDTLGWTRLVCRSPLVEGPGNPKTLIAGASYTIKAKVKLAAGTPAGTVKVGVQWRNPDGGFYQSLGESWGPSVAATDSTWGTAIAHVGAPISSDPARRTQAYVVVWIETEAAGASAYIDDVVFAEAPGSNLGSLNLDVSALRNTTTPPDNTTTIISASRMVIDKNRRRLYIPIYQGAGPPPGGQNFTSFQSFYREQYLFELELPA